MSEEPSEEVVQLAGRLFQMARTGRASALAAYVAARVSPNLCNERSDSLLMLAAYHGRVGAARALLAAGADPAAGAPSALDTARMFGREDLLAVLDRREG